MDQTEFNELHSSCVNALQNYVTSAELTAAMLERCTPEPLPLEDRLKLMVQEIAEDRVHARYLDLKGILHQAARLGYHFSRF